MPSGIYKRKPRTNTEVKHKPFCRKGHSFELVGRTPSGNCRECAKQKSLEWISRQPKDKERMRRFTSRLKSYYGITIKDWDNLFNAQEGKCAICARHQSALPYVLGVDHNHTTGKVRGLLCRACNGVLGYLEKEAIRKRMDAYLDKHKESIHE
jgi:hypothetical protein